MAVNDIGKYILPMPESWDDARVNIEKHNWQLVRDVLNREIGKYISPEIMEEILSDVRLKYKEEVATVADLPSADEENTVRVVAEDSKIYIRKTEGWQPFQTIDINKINEVDNRLGGRIDEAFSDSGEKGYNIRWNALDVVDGDWTPAVANALANGHKRIFFPPGVTEFKRQTGTDYCLQIYEQSDVTFFGTKESVIKSEVDITNEDAFIWYFKRGKNIEIDGLSFDISLTGTPSTRTNSRIMFFSGGETGTFEDVTVKNNHFKIKHADGSSAEKALYALLFGDGKDVKLLDNTFEGISGRVAEFVGVDTYKINGNRLIDLGEVYNAVGFRILTGTINGVISENKVSTKEGALATVDLIQISAGQEDEIVKTLKIYGNNFITNSSRATQSIVRISGGEDIEIFSNDMLQGATQSTNRYTTGVVLEKTSSGKSNKNINIHDNNFDGLMNYHILNNDDGLSNSKADGNYFKETADGVSGRDIKDNHNLLEVGRNHFALREDWGHGKDRKLIKYASAPPTGNDYSYFVGDIFYNTSPVTGTFVGWICNSAGNPGQWRGFGRIETI